MKINSQIQIMPLQRLLKVYFTNKRVFRTKFTTVSPPRRVILGPERDGVSGALWTT